MLNTCIVPVKKLNKELTMKTENMKTTSANFTRDFTVPCYDMVIKFPVKMKTKVTI